MSKEEPPSARSTPANLAASLGRSTRADMAKYPPYPRDWYIDSRAREIRQHKRKLADDDRTAKQRGVELSEEERAAKEQTLARIAELEAQLGWRT